MNPICFKIPMFKSCARCGFDHEDLAVRALERAAIVSVADSKFRSMVASYAFWAECPKTAEPILIDVDPSMVERTPVPSPWQKV